VGSLARVDLVQLEAQVDQDKYTRVNTQSQLANYKLQLKQLLELRDEEDFDVADPETSDSKVMGLIPDKNSVYAAALASRPEIKAGELSIQAADLSIKSARTGYMPTLNLTAGIGTSNSSGQKLGFGTQIKNNLSNSLGLTLQVPLFDQSQTRTAIRKAKFAKQDSELALQDKQKTLYNSVEKYWLDATTSQQQYVFAKKNCESMQESYELVSEQFNCGLKNIVELTTGKNNLLQAEQQLLQTKYTALLNQALLKFYAGERLEF
jgi:outer membrane protein